MAISWVPVDLARINEKVIGGNEQKKKDVLEQIIVRPKFIFPLKDYHDLLFNRRNNLISYFSKEDSEKQTETSPEKYYIRCFATIELQEILEQLKKFGVEYLQSGEAKDFRKIYTKYYPGTCEWRPGVAGSCMRYYPDDFGDNVGDVHPCEVYATNANVEISGLRLNLKTIARCILHIGKMQRTKTYAGGDTCEDCRMVEFLFNQILDKKGYGLNRFCLDGERFDIVENDSGSIIFPYIDDVLRVIVTDKHVIADRDGNINCSADGTIENEESIGSCDRCGDTICEGEDYVGMQDNMYCCRDCASNAGWSSCEGCGEYVHEDDGDIVFSDCSTFCSPACAHRSDVYACEDCGSWQHIDDLISIDDDGLYCRDCLDKCKSCNEYCRNPVDGLCNKCEKEREDESKIEEEPEVSAPVSGQESESTQQLYKLQA